jgi:hypothetical protein
MHNSNLAAPELAAIKIDGMNRSSFLLKSAVAGAAVYGGSVVSPFVGKALAQEGGGDVEILNFALTLEYLETAFYEGALKEVKGLSSDAKSLAEQLQKDEQEHVDALTQTIEQLGGTPVEAPSVSFGDAYSSEKAFLTLAYTVEPLGVRAYNGAAPQIESKDVLAAAGTIVQIEGRHTGLIALLAGENPTPDGAFSETAKMAEVLEAVKPFIKS